ncbi:hypothetical protein Hdeb2414_s0006g00206631 [Helianthus debilis subsp. tardiflorus]
MRKLECCCHVADRVWIDDSIQETHFWRIFTTRSCEGWVQHLRPSILVVRTEGYE